MPRRTYWGMFLRCFVFDVGSVVLMMSIIAVTSFYLIVRSNNYWVLISFGIVSGILFGLIWSILIAPYGKGVTVSITFNNKCELINKIDTSLKMMKYRLESRSNNILVYSSSKWMDSLIGKITIHLTDTSATIAGSSKCVKKIWKQLNAASSLLL